MVFGRRRSQSAYALNKRHYGKTYKDRMDLKKLRRTFDVVVRWLQNAQNPLQRNLIFAYAMLIRQRIRRILSPVVNLKQFQRDLRSPYLLPAAV